MAERPIGDIAQWDQAEAGAAALARLIGAYYRTLRQQGLGREPATALSLQYQGYILTVSTPGAR